jgi:hypothetical protein
MLRTSGRLLLAISVTSTYRFLTIEGPFLTVPHVRILGVLL